jgi:hypothetical protein
VLPIAISEPEPVPGYCHVFVRLESDTGLLRYLWAEVRVTRKPDPGRVTVVYSKTASPLEVETAFALGQVIESATGDVVSIMPFEDVPADSRSNLIVVGSAKDLPPTQSSRLTVTGKDSRTVEAEGMKVILQYWMQARDSAARRVGLARKDLPRGGDAAKLP